MLPPVLNGDQPLRRDGESGFLPDFLFGVGRDGLVNVAPAAGQTPCAVIFMHKQDFAVDKNSGSGIDFRGLIASLIAEQIADFLHGNIRFRGDHLRGDFPQLSVPLPVIFVLPVLKPRLCNALNADGVIQQPVVHVRFLRSLVENHYTIATRVFQQKTAWEKILAIRD